MTESLERILRVGAPVAALATVGLALRWGAPSPTRSAVVTGAPMSRAGTGLAWQVLVIDDSAHTPMPLAGCPVKTVARRRGEESVWSGLTNDDGVAEMDLAVTSADGLHLEVTSGAVLLAAGDAAIPAALPRPQADAPWARFARREGSLSMEVAVLGQRAASGFPATIWVHVTDPATRAPVAGAFVQPEGDASFVPREPRAATDARGWAEIVATPWGHAVSMILHAGAPDGRHGDWAGALYVSPGAAELTVDDRVSAGQAPVIQVSTQTTRPTAYVEVSDAQGRAWGGSAPFVARPGAPRAVLRPPKLAPGLYWAIAADDPGGAALLGPGTSVRPFFVAPSDEEALKFGTDAAECAPPGDARDLERTVSVCLSLASAAPTPRWVALEGLSRQATNDAARRSFGLALALVAIVVAAVLEALLIARATLRARARLRAAATDGESAGAPILERGGLALVAVLVAMLGFALLAGFVARMR